MTRLRLLVALTTFVVSAFGNVVSSDNVRLLKLETVLETVLHQNEALLEKVALLEKRVTNLEEENAKLKIELDKSNVQSPEEDTVEEESSTGEVQIVRNNGVKTSAIVQERQSKFRKNAKLGIQHRPAKRFLTDFQGTTVGFTAVVSPQDLTNIGAGQAIIYDYAITNVGGAYNNHSGIFIAPVKGVYVFNFAVMMRPDENEYLELVKEGTAIITNFSHATSAPNYNSSSRTVVLEVDQGEMVWVRTKPVSWHGTGNVHGYGHTTFSGWLLSITE